MSDRYRLPDPLCEHKPKGRVTAGDLSSADGVHASTYVCDRPACIEDAKAWARASTGLNAEFVPRAR